MAEGEKARMSGESPRISEPNTTLPPIEIITEKAAAAPATLPPAVYVVTWISLSSSVILFNKYLLDTMGFKFPIVLTTWHMVFATVMTQILARTTTLLDGRKRVKMTGKVYLRAILPIGFFFSLSLICGNKTYLYLSVAFIQMLKATTPVAVLLASWALRVSEPSLTRLGNVSLIVIGIMIASFGEIKFNLTGFLYQCGGLAFEAVRLVMVERLLSSPDFKMDPLVSLYYYAPVCAVINGVVALVVEVPTMTMDNVYKVGISTLVANAMIAFLLNVSVVFLIDKTSSLVLTLCGVLKDVMLVAASMFIWGTPVSALQFFGYSIAIGGLMYYKLGADQLKGYANQGLMAWSDFGVRRPALRKIVIFGLMLLTIFILLGGLAPTYAPEQTDALKNLIGAGKSSIGTR